jgi:CheY-like chemotaxis protein
MIASVRVDGSMPKAILIADDNPTIRKILCNMFEAQQGYDLCAEAANGVEAIALAKEHHPDLIILDLSMPVMNGLDAARELKKIMPDVPIILFTQYSAEVSRLSEMQLPVDRVVAKTNFTALLGHIQSLVPA